MCTEGSRCTYLYAFCPCTSNYCTFQIDTCKSSYITCTLLYCSDTECSSSVPQRNGSTNRPIPVHRRPVSVFSHEKQYILFMNTRAVHDVQSPCEELFSRECHACCMSFGVFAGCSRKLSNKNVTALTHLALSR